ncbi:tRNA 2-thiouridine(34) synthase MnmA [Caldanaerobacter subterraneus KAk]
MQKNNRVVVGMSGGVDSSVAAYLLKEQGYEVIGVTMQIWQDKDEEAVRVEGGCCSLAAVNDARRVANKIGIKYYVMNFKDVFKEKVIDYFVDEYLRGRTPNPCIACNKYIKFEELLKRAWMIDAYYVATGHYAIKEYDEERGRYLLKKSVDTSKDQTYVLYNLTQTQLEHILFPLGKYKKDEVRELAKNLGLPVASKPDSQEICFVTDNDYGKFIRENAKEEIKPGEFRDTRGRFLGYHKGIIHYTIGQRKGLGISVGKPLYVVDIDAENNVVVLGYGDEVYGDELISYNNNFISIDKLEKEMRVKAKIRYTAKEQDAVIRPLEDGRVFVKFDNPQRAITPGQSVVFYDGDIVVGGGIIERKVR